MTDSSPGSPEWLTRKDRAYALCGTCCFAVHEQASGTASTEARKHTGETGHTTTVYHRHITEYRAPGQP